MSTRSYQSPPDATPIAHGLWPNTDQALTNADVRELSAAQVNKLLGRSHGWARRHLVELGGYVEGTRYRFPVHGIKAYQERRAAEQVAARGMRRVS